MSERVSEYLQYSSSIDSIFIVAVILLLRIIGIDTLTVNDLLPLLCGLVRVTLQFSIVHINVRFNVL